MKTLGKFSPPALVSAALLLFFALWLTYKLVDAYEALRARRDALELAIDGAFSVEPSGFPLDSYSEESMKEALRRDLRPLLNDLEVQQDLITAVVAMGTALTALLFISWSYASRNRELKERLDAAMSRKSEIDEIGLAAAGLAHETKNPLGVIRGLAQNIADDPSIPDSARGKAREIMEETDVTTARLGDFLSYAKIRSPNPERLNAKAHIERIAGLMRDDFSDVGVSLETDVEPLAIEADPDMLSQILVNLLTNCLKFTEKGDKVAIKLTSDKKGRATLSVSDTGAGIPPDILPKVFKPYVTRSAGGCGIGLAIVKRIADQAGWNVKVSSSEGRGTDVSISNINVA